MSADFATPGTPTLELMASRPAEVAAAADLLRSGGLVAFPTETVYGLGGLGLDPAAVRRIFVAKGRPRTDPLILHLGAPEWAVDLARDLPRTARVLADAFWPGPLTLVVPRRACVPDAVTAGLDTVALRMPAHSVALDLIRRVGAPLAAPSANRFSRPSPTTAAHVLQDLAGRIDAVLDGGPAALGIESTVLSLAEGRPRVLRPGGVTREAIEAVLGQAVECGPVESARQGDAQPSPGLLAKHYSPTANVLLCDGSEPEVRESLRRAGRAGARVLAYSEDLAAFADCPDVVELGPRADLAVVARRLYAAFREADEAQVQRLAVASAPAGGLGDAINDRLRRAAA